MTISHIEGMHSHDTAHAELHDEMCPHHTVLAVLEEVGFFVFGELKCDTRLSIKWTGEVWLIPDFAIFMSLEQALEFIRELACEADADTIQVRLKHDADTASADANHANSAYADDLR